MRLLISDETLRDGEQQVGVDFSEKEKFRIAKEISKTGVDQIAIMPIISKNEERLAIKLLNSDFRDKIYASTMLGKEFVDHSFKLGFRKIILFSPLSDRLLKIKGITKEQNLKKAVSVCKYAKREGIRIIFAGEDSSRANFTYLIKFIQSIKDYIDYFLVCDTVGILTPGKTRKLIRHIRKRTNCKLGVHFHNDCGLADKNTISAIKKGVEMVSGTFGGIGERAGNSDLCRILLELKKEGIITDGINYSNLLKVRNLVYKLGGSKPAKPYSYRAFWVESGIHVDALLKDPLSYNSFPQQKFRKRIRIFFGKFAGKSNYKFLFGNKFSENQLIKIRDYIKNLSYKNNKSYNSKEVIRIARRIRI